MQTKQYYVYLMASRKNGTLYVGVTNDLVRRTYEHRENIIEGFTKKYGVHMLVYYEVHRDVSEALLREKRIKKWERKWKLQLINEVNPKWKDLYDDLIQ